MAKLMWICGILLVAAGLALGIVLLVSAARPGGIDIHTAAILLVGGVLALGLGSVIDGQASAHEGVARHPQMAEDEAPAAAPIPAFDPRGSKAPVAETVAVAAAVVTEAGAEDVSRPTRDTIEALEQARRKIEQAFDTGPSKAEAAAEPVAEPVVEKEEEVAEVEAEAEADSEVEDAAEDEVAELEEGQLYVVEERIIRRHPARILSDGTVEAETSEGWMRFENLEHLDEYLDAMEPARG